MSPGDCCVMSLRLFGSKPGLLVLHTSDEEVFWLFVFVFVVFVVEVFEVFEVFAGIVLEAFVLEVFVLFVVFEVWPVLAAALFTAVFLSPI